MPLRIFNRQKMNKPMSLASGFVNRNRPQQAPPPMPRAMPPMMESVDAPMDIRGGRTGGNMRPFARLPQPPPQDLGAGVGGDAGLGPPVPPPMPIAPLEAPTGWGSKLGGAAPIADPGMAPMGPMEPPPPPQQKKGRFGGMTGGGMAGPGYATNMGWGSMGG